MRFGTMMAALIVLTMAATPAMSLATPVERQSIRESDLTSETHALHFSAAVFDPLDTDPASVFELLANEGLNDRSFGMIPYVVQLQPPVHASQVAELESTGAVVTTHYVQMGGFVVLARPAMESAFRAVDGVRWAGEYLPAMKFDGFEEIHSTGVAVVVVTTFPGTDGAVRLGQIAGAQGAFVQRIDEDPIWGGLVRVQGDHTLIRSLARLPFVDTIEPYHPTAPIPFIREKLPAGANTLNGQASWVIQSFVQGQTPLWDKGLHGEGIIVGCGDTGIDYDHLVFRDTPSSAGTPGPAHRKILKLTQYANTVEESSLPHGSHVVGSILGKSINDPQGYVMNDGQAYHAKIAFMDIYDQSKGWDEIIPAMRDYFQDSYDAGARIHSNSWGGRSNTSDGDYSWRSEGADQFMWDHPDFIAVYAAGNSGPNSGTVNEPGTAKNILTIGSAQNGNTKTLSSFSSNGPNKDGVRKPDVIAPGGGITSAKGDETIGNMNTGYESWSGTSMATPTAAGGLALMQQYFNEGWYPGGTKGSGAVVIPSGPLLKAMAISSAWNQFPATNVDGHIPDNSQGWGKIRLDDVLYFQGDARKIWFDDAAFAGGLQTGDRVSYTVNVTAGEPLKVSLVWNDFPGHALINDVDLVVSDQSGTKYLGSVFANGVSTTGGARDTRNANEQVLIAAPAAGTWIVEVVATNVPKGPQPYTLLITGAISGAQKGGSSAPSVASTMPANKASGVAITTNVTVVFDRAMEKASVEAAITSNPAVAGGFTWAAGDTSVTLAPTASLTKGVAYRFTVAMSAKDASGKPMARDFQFEFTTETGQKLVIVRTDPPDGATLVLESTTISVLFNQDVKTGTAEAGFNIAPVVSGSFSWPLLRTMVFKPSAPLQEGTTYALTVSKDVEDTQGNKLGTGFSSSFTTRLRPDFTPPTVAITAPADGATLTGPFTVKVTATDDRGIFNVELVIDGNSFGTLDTAPYEWPWDTARWPNGGRSLEARARDTSGNIAKSAAQVTLDNDVDPPRVAGVSPIDQAKDVGTGAPVVITFSEPVDHSSAEAAFSLSPEVAGSFTWSGNAMTFTPGSALESGASYAIKVKTSVKDNAGNQMRDEFASSFTTTTTGGAGGFLGSAFLLPMLLAVAIAMVAVAAVLMMRRKKKRTETASYLQGSAAPQGYPCPSCGGPVAPGAPSCQNCGAGLTQQAIAWGPPGDG